MKRKIHSIFTLLLSLFGVACIFVGCQVKAGKAKASVVQVTDTMLVIQVSEVEGEVTLFSVMEDLQKGGKIEFTVVGGMITEINEKANAADYSSCWMLYTSDEDLSTSEWGTVLYEGMTCGGTIVGAQELPVTAGAYYIWQYQSL